MFLDRAGGYVRHRPAAPCRRSALSLGASAVQTAARLGWDLGWPPHGQTGGRPDDTPAIG